MMAVPLMDEALKAELRALYRRADRHYHGLGHIDELLRLAGDHRAALADPEAVEAAIWFHDAIYDSRRNNNEEKSAALAADRLADRTDAQRLRRITDMIEATARHVVPDIADEAACGDAALFLDMDLAILGAQAEIFDAYERAIRLEYAWVDDTAWRAGRGAVLRSFLSRPRIFHTDLFRESHEARARDNLSRSLAALAIRQA
ncbi:HD domain-containing protein [Mesorhizobium sp. L-8-3]|uniref:HD domain-containing protein n=1 Tax=Mesorhizobium sp. L-8-3 TaxID=2744522 RepID=UPI0019293ADE|nr:hypothetical protein [Mesorhizobium sp. L-8-3]